MNLNFTRLFLLSRYKFILKFLKFSCNSINYVLCDRVYYLGLSLQSPSYVQVLIDI
jgi:hypothetical protein